MRHTWNSKISKSAHQGAPYGVQFNAGYALLWQIDFKGYFETTTARCYPLTLIDDHSRFNLILRSCAKPNTETVKSALKTVFERYGLPTRINADNGPPWGSPSETRHGLTELTLWLIRLGIRVSHSRPYHPQTNGKCERFHRTLKTKILNNRIFSDLDEVQRAFDQWRYSYNHERPHEAINDQTPISRYKPSPISIPTQLPEIEYPSQYSVIQVGWNGLCTFKNKQFKVSNALQRLPIGLQQDPEIEDCYNLFFCHQQFGLREADIQL